MFKVNKRWISDFATIFTIFASIGFFTHCAAFFKSKTPDISEVTPEYLQAKVIHNSQKLKSFEGRARVIIELPGAGYNGFSEIFVNMPDSVLVKTEAILGIDVGALFMDHRYFGAYAPKENTLYYGEIEILDLRDFLQVELDTEELFEVFTGLVNLEVNSSSRFSFSDGKFLLTSSWENGAVKYWIDPKKFVVTKSELINRRGETVLIKQLSRLRQKKGVVVPQTIRLTRPQARERVTVYYTKQKINQAISSNKFRLRIPKNAKRIYWGDLKHPKIDRERIRKSKKSLDSNEREGH
ncbi:MAG: DUF4292 domain-containing protein [bacterium]